MGDILPSYGQAIDRIMHRHIDPMVGRDSGGEDMQFLAIPGTSDRLLTPVAQGIGTQTVACLGDDDGDTIKESTAD